MRVVSQEIISFLNFEIVPMVILEESFGYSIAHVMTIITSGPTIWAADYSLDMSKSSLTKFYEYTFNPALNRTDQSPYHRQIPPTEPVSQFSSINPS